MNYVVKYWTAGKVGYYYVTADNAQRAKEIFYYDKPYAQLLDIYDEG